MAVDGWAGRIVRVDLTRGRHRVEELAPDLARELIGGRGLAAKILLDEVGASVDPLSPENALIFAAGPLTGTGAVSGSRCMVVTKSPLTGGIASSTSAGYFGPELKFAGYDLLIVTGNSPLPVYLSINDDRVAIRPGLHLWGRTTHQTEEIIRAEVGDAWKGRETRIASIGPAGEKLARIASIVNDKHRQAGRSGAGAVMGSKNLKAVAVRGTKGLTVSDGGRFVQAVSRAMDKIKRTPLTAEVLPTLGTACLVKVASQKGILPTRHFQTSSFQGVDQISGEALRRTIFKRRRGCFACPIGCLRVTEVQASGFEGSGEGPDYGPLALLGACCGVDHLPAIAKANYLCNELGLDPTLAGIGIACTMELCTQGLIPERDMGFNVEFGDAQAVLKLIEMMGQGQGFGSILAEGSYRLCRRYGHPELSLSVKKLGVPGYDPRGLRGLGLGYATANGGSSHEHDHMVIRELLGLPHLWEAQKPVSLVKLLQDTFAAVDSTGLCHLSLLGIGLDELLAMLEAATGMAYDTERFLLAGERIWNLERLFNLKAGFDRADDTLPPRFLEEPLSGRAAQGGDQLDAMLSEYYRLRGWDEGGRPTQEKLAQLGLRCAQSNRLEVGL